MHRVIFSIMALSIAAGGPALAQTSPTKPPSTSTQTSQNNQAGQLATAQSYETIWKSRVYYRRQNSSGILCHPGPLEERRPGTNDHRAPRNVRI